MATTRELVWGGGGLSVRVPLGPGGTAHAFEVDTGSVAAGAEGAGSSPPGRERLRAPLAQVEVIGRPGPSGGIGASGGGLEYVAHEVISGDGGEELAVRLRDAEGTLALTVHARVCDGLPALHCWTEVANIGAQPVVLARVPSVTFGGFGSLAGAGWQDRLRLWVADNGWSSELRWRWSGLSQAGLAAPELPGRASRTAVGFTATGSCPTRGHLPMGALEDPGGRCWLWQAEHPGPWHWELADLDGDLHLEVCGPTDLHHQWRRRLEPGEVFGSVPATLVAVRSGGFDQAMGVLTRYRRATRRPNQDNQRLPVVFNDYMNCLMGDPTTEQLLPLVATAAKAGAEYFCIDAGWYSDEPGWWDTVGEWEPSRRRFPGGIGEVIEAITAAGMVPGLWLEPEVVGVRSPVAAQLPADAFFSREGARLVLNGRHHLDFRHPAVIERMNTVVDRLVRELGIGYFKFDYNVDAGVGTDVGADSPGDGLLGHNRAWLAWLASLFERHPQLVIENCGSGGMRMDAATLSLLSLQSTSDQTDYRRYATIAAAAPSVTTPEQAGNWAYPQPGMDDEELAFSMVNGLAGRLYLSGRPDLLDQHQFAVVAKAVQTYRDVRADYPSAVPFWPLGLPGWHDPWVALGLDAPAATYLFLWRRGGDADTCTLPVPRLAGASTEPACLYPASLPTQLAWDPAASALTVTLTARYSARFLRLARP